MFVARPVVGVDIDGVLGNQVVGVLERVNARLGLSLSYEDVVDWDIPLGDTSFVPEITNAMLDPEFILAMPVHPGAQDLLSTLRDRYFVKILTVRPPETEPLTARWLKEHRLTYDALATAREARKSLYEVDILIDDYVGNLVDFLENTTGVAVIVDQPWNQDATALDTWLGDRLVRIAQLRDVPPQILELLR